MGRWKPDAAGRLARAALLLYEQKGFERTTTAEIAAAAELTESTFFRIFADKREVLFAGFPLAGQRLVGSIRDAPADMRPIDTVQDAIVVLCGQFQAEPETVRRRLGVIAANPELMERDLTRHNGLAVAVADALQQRGLRSSAARLLAQTAILALRLALQEWMSDTTADLADLFTTSIEQLRLDLGRIT